MFGFIKEITKVMGLEVAATKNLYKYVNLGGKGLYVQGYKDILSLEKNLIVLKLKRGELEIKGKNLNIKDINISTMVVSGKIEEVKEFGYEK